MKNIKIKYRIFALSVGALIGMLIFSGYLLIEKRQVSSDMESLNELARLGPVVSAMVHEMQKERGASAGFIASKGQKFTQKLPDQRKQTDAKRTALAEALKAFDADAYGSGLVGKVEAARKAVAGLDGVRGQVSGLSITVPQMAGYYSPTIAKLLSIVEEMAVLSTNAEVTNAITAYTTFLQGKERAGIERAMGAGGFGAGEFKPPIYRRFLQLIAMQDTFLGMFGNYATAEQKAFYEKTVSGRTVDEVNRMRKIAIESVNTGDTGGVGGGDWFDTITQKINLLKTVEDKIAGDLQATATRISDEAQSAFYMVAVLSAILLALTIALSFYIVRSITTPVAAMTAAMGRLAEGDHAVEVPALGQTDEVGEMAQSVQVFKDNAIRMEQMRKEQEEAEKRAEEEKRAAMHALADDFEKNIGVVVESVASSASQMQATAQSMSATAEETSRQSTAVATASEEASQNVQTVASAAEELSTSVAEIGRQVSESATIAAEAAAEAERTNATVHGLSEAAQKIDEVINLINDIANQTNLLALNATIEAARAGEAGKGFAVVASEVKNLANQTAKATADIATQINAMQEETVGAVGAIKGITKTIGKINEIATTIASAVEEQGAATGEISRNVQEAAQGTGEVSSNITGVTQAATETGTAASEVLAAADGISKQSVALREQVDNFLQQVRVA